jgi:hydrogenase maturation protease
MSVAAPDIAPVLVLAWGNPSRGDDALGPEFVARASALPPPPGAPAIEWQTDFQLQVEHALDLAGRSQVLFVDASVDCAAPCEAHVLRSAVQRQLTTHAMAPEAVMQVYEQLHGRPPPPCTLLAIRARQFELGTAIGADAQQHLALALDWFTRWWSSLAEPSASTAPPCTS